MAPSRAATRRRVWSLRMLALLLAAQLQAAHAQYTFRGRGTFDLYAKLLDTETGLDGIFAAQIGALDRTNRTAALTVWASYPYPGITRAWLAVADAASTPLGTVYAGSGLGYDSFAITNATILASGLLPGGAPAPLQGLRFYLSYTFAPRAAANGTAVGATRTFTASGDVAAAPGLSFIAGLNGGAVAPCAPPLLALAVYPPSTPAAFNASALPAAAIWSAPALLAASAGGLYVGTAPAPGNGTAVVVYPVDGPTTVQYDSAGRRYALAAAIASEYQGSFPPPGSPPRAPAFPTNSPLHTACAGDARSKASVSLALQLAPADCDRARAALEAAFLQLAGSPSDVSAPVTCRSARRVRRTSRGALQAGRSTADFAVALGPSAPSGANAYAIGRAAAAGLSSLAGAAVFAATVNARLPSLNFTIPAGGFSLVGVDKGAVVGGLGPGYVPTPLPAPSALPSPAVARRPCPLLALLPLAFALALLF